MVDFPFPGDHGSLDRFPSRRLPAGTRIHRLHARDLGPFWFSSTATELGGGNRFDLAPPAGSSYWALQPVVAVLETLARRPVRTLPLELLDRYVMTTAPLPQDLADVANAPVKAARAFGLTAEFHTSVDRRRTRAWARALAAAGFKALIALPRHDVTGRHRTLTLFGRAGEHPPFGWTWRPASSPLDDDLIDELGPWGIRVLPIPFDVEIEPVR